MFIVYVLISFMYLRYHVAKNKRTNTTGAAMIENMHDVQLRARARKPDKEPASRRQQAVPQRYPNRDSVSQCCKPSAAALHADQAN